MVRTRVPTPHGEVFLHLYHNNRDNKEHLAIVIDPAQLAHEGGTAANSNNGLHAPFIRSKTLDAVWSESETPMERIIRGAYVGRLNEHRCVVSKPEDANVAATQHADSDLDSNLNLAALIPPPLVRIHSECFTGETIGSMRCDCGEQLDEAIRRIAEPTTVQILATPAKPAHTHTLPGRGAVIYMRQEGRGIGLLSKLRAYNLQDLGHDTVAANLLLGFGADERGYDVAAAIMRDLGLDDGVRLLTNNPDKVMAMEREGMVVRERVEMVPRSWKWKCQSESVDEDGLSRSRLHSNGNSAYGDHDHAHPHEGGAGDDERNARLRSAGATLIGASATHGPELEKYLRTKVLRMGHMLSLPTS
jgi:GTP cyclohydrolase II